MEHLFQIDQLSTERLSDGLFAQTDTEYGFPSGIGADDTVSAGSLLLSLRAHYGQIRGSYL